MVQDADVFTQAVTTSEDGLKGSSTVLVELLNSCFVKTKSPSISIEDLIKTVFPYAKHEERHRMLAMLDVYDVLCELAKQVRRDLAYEFQGGGDGGGGGGGGGRGGGGKRGYHKPARFQITSEVRGELDTCFFRCKSDHFGTVGLTEFLEVLHSHHLVPSVEEFKKNVLSKEELKKAGSGKELEAAEASLILSEALEAMQARPT